jgi:hypothetical protein
MKNNVNNFKATIEEKKAMLDMLQYVIEDIEYRENGILDHFVENGEEQRTDKDGNPLYLDENGEKTTEVTDKPYMRTLYETVRRDPSELDEYDLPKYQALMKIKNAVLALI